MFKKKLCIYFHDKSDEISVYRRSQTRICSEDDVPSAFYLAISGYYAWRKRPKSEREQKNEELTQRIRQIFEHNRQIYGSPRIHVELKDLGVNCSRKHVARLMRVAGMSAQHKCRRVRTTDSSHKNLVANNHVNREFIATEPNTKWAGDMTGIETAQGWLYLAVILDLSSRKVVGWSMSSHRDEELVERALQMALLSAKGVSIPDDRFRICCSFYFASHPASFESDRSCDATTGRGDALACRFTPGCNPTRYTA
ncbi:IS3 family transposase [Ktedonobacter sp. SOSP1-52]|uniref:IS3 family transposase n=1 Tax=Ktedonobacter sp. SOSP1-52 TaxID=2778366 RepID=UPI0027DC57AF|nr:IS3 family transposase [Ktedonobacter sp. SOSP1-52]